MSTQTCIQVYGLLAKPQEALEKSEAANEVQTTTLSISLLGTHPQLSEKHRCIRARGYTLPRTPSKLRPGGNTYMLFD